MSGLVAAVERRERVRYMHGFHLGHHDGFACAARAFRSEAKAAVKLGDVWTARFMLENARSFARRSRASMDRWLRDKEASA